MSRQDEQLDAAEYVIGTMTAAERAAFEDLLEADETARTDVTYWQQVFGTLSATVPPEVPSGELWSRIEADLPGVAPLGLADAVRRDAGTSALVGGRTDRDSLRAMIGEARKPMAANDNINALERSRGRWRLGAIAATIAALALGLTAFNDGVRERVQTALAPFGVSAPSQVAEENDSGAASPQVAGNDDASPAVEAGRQYIAVVNSAADQPALIVKVDATTGRVSVRSLGMDRPEGKSLELWYVPEGGKAISVGLVGESDIDLGDLSARSGDLLAISLEPEGGAPEGVATGPVIYTGKLIEDVDAGSVSLPRQ